LQYLILATETAADFDKRDDPVAADGYWAAWSSYIAVLAESGVLVSAGGLMPPYTATTIRRRDGERVVEDGPYADTKEQLGGYFVIEVDDLDAALAWAGRCPSLDTASVEVRPLLPPPAS
jgi:hypothetical protein